MWKKKIIGHKHATTHSIPLIYKNKYEWNQPRIDKTQSITIANSYLQTTISLCKVMRAIRVRQSQTLGGDISRVFFKLGGGEANEATSWRSHEFFGGG